MIGNAEEFVDLRRDNDDRATHDSASESVWVDIVHRYSDFREWVAHNKTVPVSVLRLLSEDPDPKVRFAVAIKRKCPSDIMGTLSIDSDELVRYQIALNPKTPLVILRSMEADSSQRIRQVVKERLDTSLL